MNIKRLFTFIGITTVLLCTNIFGQENQQNSSEIAQTLNNGTSISWSIKMPYESATLTVSTPDGKTYRRQFAPGAAPNFSPLSEKGKFFTNGIFTYEIVLTPVLSPDVKRMLEESRRNGNTEEATADLRLRGLLPRTMVESGSFGVLNGTIIKDNLVESESPDAILQNGTAFSGKNSVRGVKKYGENLEVGTEAQVIADDLIVNGSSCIGIDCSNTETFDFDTIRLKENNLQIHFEDTSSSSLFPSGDWRLIANDNSNGGANYFAIQDSSAGNLPFRVYAGAGANALTVTSIGNIGVGTNNPNTSLQITRGNTPILRFEQNGSTGFTPQSWDIAGNETEFFIRDVTNGSLSPFRIKSGAQSGTLTLGVNGYVGMGLNGSSLPTEPLDVRNRGTQLLKLDTFGKLTVASTVQIQSGGIIFSDGSVQTTAATGGSGTGTSSLLGAKYSQSIFGGQGTIASFSTIAPTVDFNRYAIGTGGAAGFLTSTFAIPSNTNLADTAATMIIYKIRYRDQDGTGNASQVRVDLVAVATDGGGRANTVVFDSNTSSNTGFNTVTVCMPTDGVNFNYALRGMHLNVSLIGTAAASADFGQIQIYKDVTCP